MIIEKVINMSKTLYGDAFILLHLDSVDIGEPDDLHDIFDLAIQNGANPLKTQHPLNVFQRVLNGLDRDERFEKYYIEYHGIYKMSVRVFELKSAPAAVRSVFSSHEPHSEEPGTSG